MLNKIWKVDDVYDSIDFSLHFEYLALESSLSMLKNSLAHYSRLNCLKYVRR